MTETSVTIEGSKHQEQIIETVLHTGFDEPYKITVTVQDRLVFSVEGELMVKAGAVNRYEGGMEDFIAAGVSQEQFVAIATQLKQALYALVAYRKSQAAV